MALKVYSDLNEALKDIDYWKGMYNRLELGYYTEKGYQRPFDEMVSRIKNSLGKKSTENLPAIKEILEDLISNTFRRGVPPDPYCMIDVYLGEKGALCGTIGNSEFLVNEQIPILRRDDKTPTTHKQGKIEIITTDLDGISIGESSVYVSKYYSENLVLV